MRWKYAYGSVAGSRHKKFDIPCQDSSDVRIFNSRSRDAVLAAIASDGAGSAKCAQTGARLCCSSVMEGLKDFFDGGNEVFNLGRGAVEKLVLDFQQQVKVYCEATGFDVYDYACTLVCAVVGYKNSVFFQIGDGAIVIQKYGEDGYAPVFWPGKGEYENSTHFAVSTESVARNLKYGLVEGTIEKIAVFTDGIERLALNFRGRSAFGPFFKPMFEEIRSMEGCCSNAFLESVILFLNSSRVNGRTDDDKTLIIASRCD